MKYGVSVFYYHAYVRASCRPRCQINAVQNTKCKAVSTTANYKEQHKIIPAYTDTERVRIQEKAA